MLWLGAAAVGILLKFEGIGREREPSLGKHR